jgi:hypothetical protein
MHPLLEHKKSFTKIRLNAVVEVMVVVGVPYALKVGSPVPSYTTS